MQENLGTTVEYVFSDRADSDAYRVSSNRRSNPRRAILLTINSVAFAGFLVYMVATNGWYSGLIYLVTLGILGLKPLLEAFGKTRYTKLVLKIHPGWIALIEEGKTSRPKFKPFTVLLKARQTKSIEWQDDVCVFHQRLLCCGPLFIDKRLYSQEGACSEIFEWAKLHEIEVVRNPTNA